MATLAHASSEGAQYPISPTSTTPSKFPPFDLASIREEDRSGRTRSRDDSPDPTGARNGSATADRWRPRRDSSVHWGNGAVQQPGTKHGRQRSLSEAIRLIRARRGSVSQNAHELADALKAPVSPKVISLCAIWYITSIMSNTSSKAILTAFPKPVTLTLVQFAFVSSYCLLFSWLAQRYSFLRTWVPALKNGIRPASRELLRTTLPLTGFMIGGHILSSDATSRIPVALVHTIKGLSPLFTVLAYRFVFNIRYSTPTYLSLCPLTLGVILACSASVSGNIIGLCGAFGSALLFVTQNIVSKKLFNEAALAEAEGPQRSRKPDKLNLLYYSSGLAFLCTFPIWFWTEGFHITIDFLHDAHIKLSNKPGALDHGRLGLEFIFNGTFHFGQNLVAFILLSMVSPVTYSVASLIKRVFVISFAIVWFGNHWTRIQGVGIALTFLGLYLYDRTSDAAKADRRARALQLRGAEPLLPIATDKLGESSAYTQSPANLLRPTQSGSISNESGAAANGYIAGYEEKLTPPAKQRESIGFDRWLPPGTKQEDTWDARDAGKR